MKYYLSFLGLAILFTQQANAQVGIGTTNPKAGLHVADSSVVFGASGPVDLKGTLPISGAGRRVFWYPGKAAFRIGYVDAKQWDQENIGNYSFAAGYNAVSSGTVSVAMGDGARALGYGSVAFGRNTSSTGQAASAMGENSTASGIGSTAIGMDSKASNYGSTAIGSNTNASGYQSMAIGASTTASESNSTAMGSYTTASGYTSTAIGFGTNATGGYSTAMGNSTSASGSASTALGNNTKAGGFYSTAMGNNTDAGGNFSTAMGNYTNAGGNFSTAMGSYTNAGGSNSTAMGDQTLAPSRSELVVGQYNQIYTPLDNSGWNTSDRLFSIGNGINDTNRKNAMTVLKSGNTGIGLSAPSQKLEVDGNVKSNAVILASEGGIASPLNHYEESSYSSKLYNGPVTYMSSYPVTILRIGKMVTLSFPTDILSLNVTANDIVFSGIPTRFCPGTNQYFSIRTISGGTPQMGLVFVQTNGFIYFKPNASGSSWGGTNSGFYATTLSYFIN